MTHVPDPIATPHGAVAFAEETWTIEPREIQTFFQAEEVFWTADRSLEQWRKLLACSCLLTARLTPEGGRGGRLVGTLRVWSDHAYEAKLYDVVTAADMQRQGIASALVRWSLRHPWVGPVKRYCLDTRDAVPLYPKFGFVPSQDSASTHMRVEAVELVKRGLR